MTAFVGIVATILLGWLLISAAAILQPVVIALLLCNLLRPVVRALARYHIPSWATVVILLVGLVWLLVEGGYMLFAEVREFVGDTGSKELTDDLIRRLNSYEELPLQLRDFLTDLLQGLDPRGFVIGLFGTVKDFMLGLFLVVLYMIFIFAEQAVFRSKILAIARDRAPVAEKALDSISLGIQRYLGVKTVMSLATGILCYSVLLYLKLPYALLFGFLTYLLNYIPTFGSIVAAIPPIATALADRQGLTDPLIVTGTYIAVNTLLGSFLEPRMLGRELNLSPLVIIISVVTWAALWGVPGTFLAVPLTATVQIILANFESTRPIAILMSNAPPRDEPEPTRPSPA